ncbi:hypothetical protein HPB48_022616 [Haemaphysalis longicornis]|uniref:DDE-1 domain-containing protein n=1 Tax=Haemaphysalis longicornis TaxID=44386 RepID=A0A9J6H5L5_HAELO|nr:hypothetical protein HPB48_022616 [Haemaphysalis longicornis]
MTGDLFAYWLSEFHRDMQRQGRRVLLVINNCSSPRANFPHGSDLLFLPPNTASNVQPLDLGIIRAFKASYRPRVVERLVIAVDRPEANLPLRVSLYSAVEIVETRPGSANAASWAEMWA